MENRLDKNTTNFSFFFKNKLPSVCAIKQKFFHAEAKGKVRVVNMYVYPWREITFVVIKKQMVPDKNSSWTRFTRVAETGFVIGL